jgi:hypothetical protein
VAAFLARDCLGIPGVQGGGVEPYRIGVPDRELERLQLRLADTRWPDRERSLADDIYSGSLPTKQAHRSMEGGSVDELLDVPI